MHLQEFLFFCVYLNGRPKSYGDTRSLSDLPSSTPLFQSTNSMRWQLKTYLCQKSFDFPPVPICTNSHPVASKITFGNGVFCLGGISLIHRIEILASELGTDHTGCKDFQNLLGTQVYSDWPSYPQLYVQGDLVGGCDILEEMASSGELADILPQSNGRADTKSSSLEDRLRALTTSADVVLFMKVLQTVELSNPSVLSFSASDASFLFPAALPPGLLSSLHFQYQSFRKIWDEEGF